MEGSGYIPERRKEGTARKTDSEEVAAEMLTLTPETDIEAELLAIREKLRNIQGMPREEFFRLQVRRAALLEYRANNEPSRLRGPTTLEEADEVPTVSAAMARRYPSFDTTREEMLDEARRPVSGARGGDTRPLARPPVKK